MTVKTSKRSARVKNPCLVCGKPIPQARLKVLPETKTCVKCASVERYSSRDLPIDVFAQHTTAFQLSEDE